jgi:predicted PurR-regulated permease PerM
MGCVASIQIIAHVFPPLSRVLLGALDSMQNINPWLWSAFVLSLSGIFFRWVFGNTFVSLFLAVLLALAIVPLVKKIQRKN